MASWEDRIASFEHRVTFSETDGLGYVHHARAAIWFEQARERFFRQVNVPAVSLFERGWYLAVRGLNVRYDSFIGYENELTTRVALTKLGRVALDFHYRVENRTTGKVALRGHTNLVAVEAPSADQAPVLGRLRFDRAPFEKMVVDVDEFFALPTGAWAPPQWEPTL